MPRAGGVYSAPPGTTATPNTTVASAPYNALVADLVADANAARPVGAGGIGASTAVGGLDNLNAAGASIASAATVNLANATGVALTITGTVTITSFGTVAAGAERVLTFAGILTLTYNATSMILPGAANIVTAAGDVATFRSLGSGNWKCVGYTRATGAPTVNTLILKQSAAPTPTTEGDVQWDTDDNAIAIGDGAATQLFLPIPASTAAGDIEYFSGAKAKARLAKGTAGQSLIMNAGATGPAWGSGRVLGASVATTSGVAVDITGIPSWVTEVVLNLNQVSTSGASPPIIQLGSASGVENTGYNGSVGAASAGSGQAVALTDGLRTSPLTGSASDSLVGMCVLRLIEASTNTWAMSINTGFVGGSFASFGAATKALAAPLDRIRITTQGGVTTFDAGKISISYS